MEAIPARAVPGRTSVRVVVADPTPATRSAVARVLSDAGWVTVVAETQDTATTLAAVEHARVDAVVVDDRLVDEVGALLAPGSLRGRPRLIAMGLDDDPVYAHRARRAGAEALVAKHLAVEELLPLLARSHGALPA